MPLIPDAAVFQERLASLPVTSYQTGEIVIAAGSTTDRLLILKNGAVAILKDGIQIATVAESGAIFGELSALLGQPHTADVRALEKSHFHIADATTLLTQDPIALLYVAAVLAQRLNGANQALIQLRNQLDAGQPRSVIGKTVAKMEGLLEASGASLMYAGYPSDPYGRG
jgi:CRP/FNR family transcriptional regulator, cyclic AMP receptor protein